MPLGVVSGVILKGAECVASGSHLLPTEASDDAQLFLLTGCVRVRGYGQYAADKANKATRCGYRVHILLGGIVYSGKG